MLRASASPRANRRMLNLIDRLCVIATILTASAAHAAGNASTGASLFNRCALCHSNAKGAPNKLGPNLFGVVGRKAGTYPGFSYSAAMKRAGFVWTPARLSDYLASPQAVVPGNNMPFAGIADPRQRTDIVAYLATLK
jgi:cytochrome c